MFFEPGFLGTKALMYMDIVTLYFAILPFLLGLSIYQAMQGNHKLHYQSQFIILCVTLVMVIIFEIGVRVTGGFVEYAKESPISYDFLLLFLIVHIFIAIMAVGGWIYLIISAYKSYRNDQLENKEKHRRMGRWIFVALTVTSIMGSSIYLFLFC
jgi:putative membrane protein